MTEREIRVCLYSPADLNIVSGSSIWVQSVAETLHAADRVHVTVPLRCLERRRLISDRLRRLGRVELVDPRRQRRFVPPEGLYSAEVLDLVETLDRERPFDAILLRSFSVCLAAVERPRLRGRLWSCYVLEPERDMDDLRHLADLAAIADASRYVVVQSEEMRALFEALVPAGRGKTIILPPAVPPALPDRAVPAEIVERMLYAGKFHPFYPVPRMVDFLVELRRAHPALEFHVIGDQIFRPPGDEAYAHGLEHALSDTDGVVWHGALTRDETIALLARGGVALSLWDYRYGSTMNDLVVSTKLLDYCAAGLPVILNRTAAQETILGADYPLFVRTTDEALPLLRAVLSDPDLYRAAAARCREAARPFEYPRVYALLAPFLEERPDAALRQFERPKLPEAEFNVGLLLPAAAAALPGPALDLLGSLRAQEARFRLLAGRLPAPGAGPALAGADPAAALLESLAESERWAVSARTVEDPANWWRTAGFALSVPDGDPAWSTLVAQAAASGAIPLLVGATSVPSAFAQFLHASPAAAGVWAADLVATGGWSAASARVREAAFARGGG